MSNPLRAAKEGGSRVEANERSAIEDRMKAIENRFMASLPMRISQIKSALEACEWGLLDELGHKLKGTSACLSLTTISVVGKKVQTYAGLKSAAEISSSIEELQRIYNLWVARQN
jgi:HPt (histidine-containing phosphotransfer) domain-containing protein